MYSVDDLWLLLYIADKLATGLGLYSELGVLALPEVKIKGLKWRIAEPFPLAE